MIQFIEMLVVPKDASRYTSSRICTNMRFMSVSFSFFPRSLGGAERAVDARRRRKGHRYADRLGQAVDRICKRNPDQSRDRDEDNIYSPHQHGKTLSRGACEQGVEAKCVARSDIGPPSLSAGKSQTKTFCLCF